MSENNLTEFNLLTRRHESWNNDYGLFSSLQLAGSSFGIVTEFHYRIFNGAEVQPVFVLVYVENEMDIRNFEAAATNGRYHMCLHNILDFTSHTYITGIRAASKLEENYVYIHINRLEIIKFCLSEQRHIV